MIALIQRVSSASVKIENQLVSSIESGLLILLGVTHSDNEAEANKLANKIALLRIFNDENQKMNLSVQDIEGDILVVSQFTLFADCKKGNRPSYINSARPDQAFILYEYFIKQLNRILGKHIPTGKFGAHMEITLQNDGPVTIHLDSNLL